MFIIYEMAKRKYPSELDNKQVRVSLDDYALLKDISEKAHITMAKALHRCLAEKEKSPCRKNEE